MKKKQIASDAFSLDIYTGLDCVANVNYHLKALWQGVNLWQSVCVVQVEIVGFIDWTNAKVCGGCNESMLVQLPLEWKLQE